MYPVEMGKNLESLYEDNINFYGRMLLCNPGFENIVPSYIHSHFEEISAAGDIFPLNRICGFGPDPNAMEFRINVHVRTDKNAYWNDAHIDHKYTLRNIIPSTASKLYLPGMYRVCIPFCDKDKNTVIAVGDRSWSQFKEMDTYICSYSENALTPIALCCNCGVPRLFSNSGYADNDIDYYGYLGIVEEPFREGDENNASSKIKMNIIDFDGHKLFSEPYTEVLRGSLALPGHNTMMSVLFEDGMIVRWDPERGEFFDCDGNETAAVYQKLN